MPSHVNASTFKMESIRQWYQLSKKHAELSLSQHNSQYIYLETCSCIQVPISQLCPSACSGDHWLQLQIANTETFYMQEINGIVIVEYICGGMPTYQFQAFKMLWIYKQVSFTFAISCEVELYILNHSSVTCLANFLNNFSVNG
ncbi:Hypothetical_protein [Hexamita inflata]|uniref:Hypothetical_protein n=1 Tax=Hexamita inflata TaxID=28002 RepID=A0AA86R0W8_9EUKA|nr:Hypothetical protein HINF_LOCUS57231 [Hexamita inflata]CAI9969589.1 Hypothetical protein HINF_LOCUS57234 [Hexamita inflata]